MRRWLPNLASKFSPHPIASPAAQALNQRKTPQLQDKIVIKQYTMM